MPQKIFNKNTVVGVQVFLELKSKRLYVGLLRRDNKKKLFCFEYDLNYLKNRHAIPLGPEMPLTRRSFQSDTLFIPFAERIPSQDNPAYEEYCKAMGISVHEVDALVLLSTIAHRGPSSFIFEPLYEDIFTSEDLLHFRKSLGLSVKEFAACFDFSPAAVTRVELKQSSGREVLKRAEIYIHYPEVALDLIRRRGGVLHSNKQKNVECALERMLSNHS